MIVGTRCDREGTTTYIPMEDAKPIVGIMVNGSPNYNLQSLCEGMLLANDVLGDAVDKMVVDPSPIERRLFEAAHHARFLRLENRHDGETHSWTIHHVPDYQSDAEAPCEGCITSGSLDNLLTAWESLCEGWRGDAFDGIG